MPPDDDFRRERDPRARRTAAVTAGLAVACLAALLAGLWLARSQGTSSMPLAAATASPTVPGEVLTPTPPVAGQAPPSARPTPVPAFPVLGFGFSAAFDSATHQLVVFGGVDSYDVTWLWDGHGWSLARPAEAPPGRFHAAMAYDPQTGTVMLFGGRLGPGQLVTDTWAWDGRNWRELDAETGPLPSYAVMAWDDPRRQMVLVGDDGSNVGTWTWTGDHWARQPRGDLPAGAALVGMAVDPTTRLLVGVSCCSAGQGDTATLAWDGATWRKLATPTVPGFAVALVEDPVSRRLLLFGAPSLAAEVWTWNGGDWLLVPGARVPEFPSGAVVDTDTHRTVIAGSAVEPVQGNPQPIHLWTLNGSGWQAVA